MHTREVERNALYVEFDDYTICQECLEEMSQEEYDYLDTTEADTWINDEQLWLHPLIFPQGLHCDKCGTQILESIDELEKRVERNTTK